MRTRILLIKTHARVYISMSLYVYRFFVVEWCCLCWHRFGLNGRLGKELKSARAQTNTLHFIQIRHALLQRRSSILHATRFDIQPACVDDDASLSPATSFFCHRNSIRFYRPLYLCAGNKKYLYIYDAVW